MGDIRPKTCEGRELTKNLAGLVGAGRLIEPEEVGKLLLFSAENPVINGAVLHANLGQIEG